MEVFRLRIPTPPSGKNRQRIMAAGKKCKECGRKPKTWIMASAEAEQAAKGIRAAAAMAANQLGWHGHTPLFGDDDVSVLYTVHARSGSCLVEVRSIGPRPDGFSGRMSDLHNVPDVLLDALQGIVFENDNAVRRIAGVRRVD